MKYPAIALVVGILSGLLTAEATRFLAPANPWIGVIFGASLTLLAWLKYKSCSAWTSIALIASSVASYFVAVWGALFITGLLNPILGDESGFTQLLGPGMFAIAGFLGALMINMTLLLLLSQQTGLRMIGRAAAFAAAGAFLGLLSSELTGSVGATIRRLIADDRAAFGFRDYYPAFCSAYLIWQTGMALLIPLTWPHPKDLFSRAGQASAVAVSPRELSIFGKVFFSCVFAAAAFLLFSIARDLYLSSPHPSRLNFHR